MGTTGTNLDREIAALAVPAALALATEPLYDLCDTAVLGHLGASALAGAALATRLAAFGTAAFVFLMFGTTAAVARRDGAGDHRGAVDQGVAALWLGAAIGAAAGVVVWLVGPALIDAAGVTSRVAADARTYLRISAAGMPAVTMVLAGVGYRRGRRDTRTPLLVAAATVTLNLALELALVLGAGWGVAASALGTVVAKWCGALVYVALVGRDVRSSGASWRPRRADVGGQLVVGRDLLVRTLLLLGVLAVAQAWAGRLGTVEAAAYAVAIQLWMVAAYAVDGLEAAGQTMVAHRLGAGRHEEVRAVVARVVRWGGGIGVLTGGLLAATAVVAPRAFTDDGAVAAAATASLWWVAVTQPVNGVAFALDGIGVGAGRQRGLAAGMAAAAVAFAATAVTADRWLEATGAARLAPIWVTLLVFMAVRTAAGWVVARRVGSPSDAQPQLALVQSDT